MIIIFICTIVIIVGLFEILRTSDTKRNEQRSNIVSDKENIELFNVTMEERSEIVNAVDTLMNNIRNNEQILDNINIDDNGEYNADIDYVYGYYLERIGTLKDKRALYVLQNGKEIEGPDKRIMEELDFIYKNFNYNILYIKKETIQDKEVNKVAIQLFKKDLQELNKFLEENQDGYDSKDLQKIYRESDTVSTELTLEFDRVESLYLLTMRSLWLISERLTK